MFESLCCLAPLLRLSLFMAMCWGWALGLDFHGSTVKVNFVNREGGAPKTAAEHPRSIALRRRPAMLWADNETVEMAPMVHEIENSNCMLQLVRRTSPFKNATTQMMIPKAYNLLARDQVMYKHPGIPHRFKAPCFLTCALVGSSGVLRRSGWGRMIDSYEAVIRLNNAPTYQHERDVGSRTTVRVMHDVHVTRANIPEFFRMDPGGLVLAWPPLNKRRQMPGPPPNLLGGAQEKRNVAAILQNANSPVLMTRMSLRAFKDSQHIASKTVGPFPPFVPSTGWYALYAALHMCREIHVFGIGWTVAKETMQRAGHKGVGRAYYFWKHAKGRKDEASYYDTRNAKSQMSFHDFGEEKAGMLKLAHVYNITFH